MKVMAFHPSLDARHGLCPACGRFMDDSGCRIEESRKHALGALIGNLYEVECDDPNIESRLMSEIDDD